MSRILIVEDYAITREPLARLLRYEGYEVDCAANGVEAMQYLEQQLPDLILLDVMMPKMNGIALLETMRANERLKHVPVIAITGSQDSSHIGSIRACNVLTIFSKSRFTIDELLSEMERCLKAKASPVGTPVDHTVAISHRQA
jgi:CheY-like chemotaxis protein